MRDFTLRIFKMLLTKLNKSRYRFMTFAEFMEAGHGEKKLIILRHDVDKKPSRSLRTAQMENKLGIKGTYYFRVGENKFPGKVIRRIAKLGHEIGYHYNDLSDAGGQVEKAIDLFRKNLAKLREFAPVKTVCMHGSPMSRFDNRDMWQERNYREFGIMGEPYFDVDFNKVLYLTDTGRRWDGDKVSIRDKVRGNRLRVMGKREDSRQNTEDREQNKKSSRGAVSDPPALYIHSTQDIIEALKKDRLPSKIMLTVHPQRWTDNYFFWMKELIWQKIKNVIKYLKVKRLDKIGKK